jgi:hypothetical protein
MPFEFSEKRFFVVKDDEIRLFEDGSNKVATFSYPRWAQFVEFFDKIDNAVNKLIRDEEVKLRLHIGASWYVSVATGYRCVDIRKCYLAQDVLSNRQRPALRCDSSSGAACWRWSRTSRRNIPRSPKLSTAGLRLPFLIRRVL